MQSRVGLILKFDVTFKMAKKVKQTHLGKTDTPFKGFATVMNEYSEIIWYGWTWRGESMEELKPRLLALKRRGEAIHGKDWYPVAFYIDNCCTKRDQILAIFPKTLVLLDPFHYMARWNVSRLFRPLRAPMLSHPGSLTTLFLFFSRTSLMSYPPIASPVRPASGTAAPLLPLPLLPLLPLLLLLLLLLILLRTLTPVPLRHSLL